MMNFLTFGTLKQFLSMVFLNALSLKNNDLSKCIKKFHVYTQPNCPFETLEIIFNKYTSKAKVSTVYT